MIRDKKLIEHYTEKYGVLPIVFSWDGMVFSSEHFNKKEINGRITYDFSLSIPNKPKIFIKSVIEYQFLFPPKKRIDGLPCYTYSDEERVIERLDCNDCILILYRMDGFYKDVLIFYNFEKKFLLKSVSLLVRPYWFDCNNFVYYDKKYRPCFVYDGELYNEENLKCTLYDWCIKYKSEKILNMFSAKNSLAAKDILWKSKEEYKWECNAGHIFLEQPKNLLLANGHFEDLCPFCKEIKDKKNAIISEENKKQHLKFIHKIYEKYGVNSPNEAYLIVRQKLLDAIEYAKNNPPWREPSNDWPKTAKGIFKYESNSDETLPKIILDAYSIEPSRAFKYLRWLWETFPYDILKEVKDGAFDHPTYKSRARLVFRLITENEKEKSNELLNFLCENKTINAVFYESLIEKHERIVALDYMQFLLQRSKYKESVQVYKAYKEGQAGRISEQDLSDLWDDLFVLYLDEEKIPLWLHEYVERELQSFKPHSNRAIKSFAKVGIIYPESYQVVDVDCDNPLVEIEDDNWISKVPIFRKSVNRSQFTDAINLVYKVSFSTSKDYITESGIWRLIRENGLAEYIGIENQKFNILDKGKAYLELGEKNSIKITYIGQKFLLSKLYKWHK